MAKQTNSKVAKEGGKYLFNRIKVMVLMIILMIVVKNHPGWDAFFVLIFILQIILSFVMLSKLPDKMEEEARQERKKYQHSYQNFYNHQRQRGSAFSDRIGVLTSFKILGITTNDTEETIKKQYRKLVMKWHPDKFSNDSPENQEKAKRNFQKISNAYNDIKKYKNIN